MRNKQIINNRDYKKGLMQYRKYVAALKKRKHFIQDLSLSINPYDVFRTYELTTNEENRIMREIESLDKTQVITFAKEHFIDYEPKLFEYDRLLYHGLRFQQNLEKLEGIFKERKILAGKYLDNFFNYSDNCNDGEYVSVINYNDSVEFKSFISENICLVISPLCNAYKTVYVSHDIWNYIKKHNIPVKNRYSYAKHEYQVKDLIPIEMVKAVSVE